MHNISGATEEGYTPGDTFVGCDPTSCVELLSTSPKFTYGGTEYEVTQILLTGPLGGRRTGGYALFVSMTPSLPQNLVLRVGNDVQFAVKDGTGPERVYFYGCTVRLDPHQTLDDCPTESRKYFGPYGYAFWETTGLRWAEGDRVSLSLVEVSDDTPRVSLSPSEVLVKEGEQVTVTATLSKALGGDVTIPLTLGPFQADSGGTIRPATFEATDVTVPTSITIPAGSTSATAIVQTHQDDDMVNILGNQKDESLWLRLHSGLPPSVVSGASRKVDIRIIDDDPLPTLSLGVWPHVVWSDHHERRKILEEGSTATVTVRVDRHLGYLPAVIPLTFTPTAGDHAAEAGDYSELLGISVQGYDGGSNFAINQDSDEDWEKFTLALSVPDYLQLDLTDWSTEKSADSVQLWIRDDEKPQPQKADNPPPQPLPQKLPEEQGPTAVTLALGDGASDRMTVDESAGAVTLTATLDAPAPPGGINFRLVSDLDDIATRDLDYTMPEIITIISGERSGTASIWITDDNLDESDETANIIASAALIDADLTGRATLTIADDDTAGVTVSTGGLLLVSEDGSGSYTVALKSQPTAAVTITPVSGNEGAATVFPGSVTILPENWNLPETIFVYGVSDDDQRNETLRVSHRVTSPDPGYDNLAAPMAIVVVSDTTGQQRQDPPPNRAPTVVSAIADATITSESGTHEASLSGIFRDADGDSLTVTATSSNQAVATASVSAGYTLTVSAKSKGTATIMVTADDGRGGTISDTLAVRVKAAPVVASAIGDVSLEEGATQEVPLSGVFSDPDGDALTIIAWSSDDAIATVTVSADQSKLTVAGVAEGAAVIDLIVWDTDENSVFDDFAVTVTAPQPQEQQPPPEPDPQQQGQDPPNQAPTVASAIADATIVNQSGMKEVSLSGTFSDADNDALTITAESSNQAVATVTVAADYSNLTVTAKSRGTATVTVTASDGNGGTVSDAFTVTVKAAPVVASTLGDASMEEGATQDVSLSGAFSDADGDTLTISTASSDDSLVGAFAFQGTLTVAAFSAGSATITVTAQDSDGNTVGDEFSVTVTAPEPEPANQPPTVASAIGDATIVNQSGTKQVSLSGNFSDADGDALTITAVSSNDAVATATVASDYSSLTVNAQSRGTATITVTADDGNGGTVSDSFAIRVKSAPVVASAISNVFGLEAGSSRDVSLSGVFSDADGDALTITASSSDDAKATVTVAADQSKLTLTGVAEGAATITVTARDSDGNTVSDTFDVSVEPEPEQDPPPESSDESPTVVSPLPDISLEGAEHREFDLSAVFQDPDGDELTFSAKSSNYGVATTLHVNGTTLTVVATGNGTATITVTAEDPDGNQVSDEFEVTVAPVS